MRRIKGSNILEELTNEFELYDIYQENSKREKDYERNTAKEYFDAEYFWCLELRGGLSHNDLYYLTIVYVRMLNEKKERLEKDGVQSDLQKKMNIIANKCTRYLKYAGSYDKVVEHTKCQGEIIIKHKRETKGDVKDEVKDTGKDKSESESESKHKWGWGFFGLTANKSKTKNESNMKETHKQTVDDDKNMTTSIISGAAIYRDIIEEYEIAESFGEHMSDNDAYAYINIEYYFYWLDRDFHTGKSIVDPYKIDCLTTVYVEILNRKIKRLKTDDGEKNLKEKIKFMESKFKQSLITHGIYEEVIELKNKKITRVESKQKRGSEIAREILEEYTLDELSEKNRSDCESLAYKCIKDYFECLDCDFEEERSIVDPDRMNYLTNIYVEILNRKMERQKSEDVKNALKMKIDFIESTFLSALESYGYRRVELTDEQMAKYEPKLKAESKYKSKLLVFRTADEPKYKWGFFCSTTSEQKTKKIIKNETGTTHNQTVHNGKNTKTADIAAENIRKKLFDYYVNDTPIKNKGRRWWS